IGKYDETTNKVHKALAISMQQTPQGINVGMYPVGAPILANPEQKEFITLELSPSAIGWKVDLTDPQANMQMRQLRSSYEQITSSTIMTNGGVASLKIPAN